MRARAALLAGLLLVALPAAPGSASSTERRQSLTYSLTGSEKVRAAAGEDRVTVTARDATSAVVRVTLDVVTPGGRSSEVSGCNRVSAPVVPGSTVTISTGSGFCGAGQAALSTYGTLQVAFHRAAPRAPRPPSAAERWALVIGIQHYAGRTEQTVGGLGDAAAVRSALLHSGWRDDHIRVLTDTQATADGIRGGIDWLASRSSPTSFSLLHYSGHICIASRGPCGSGHTWWWGQDNRFLSEDEVAARLARVQGYAWLDVAGCESGAFDVGWHSPTHLFSASSRADETSYEDPGSKQSVYVQFAWSRGYREGRADSAGRPYRATMRQMAAYARDHAPAYTSGGQVGSQHPVFAGGDPSWRLWATPG